MGLFSKVAHGFENDAKGLVDPRNYLRAGKQLATNPIGFGKAIGNSYLDMARHPIRAAENHPLDTLLQFAPLGGAVAAKMGILGRVGEAAKVAEYTAPASKEELFARAASRARGPAHTVKGESTFGTPHIGAANKPMTSAAAIRDSLDRPTQWGAGEHISGPRVAQSKNELLTSLMSQGKIGGDMPLKEGQTFPGLRSAQPKSEGPASFKDVAGPGREVYDFSHEGEDIRHASNYRVSTGQPLGTTRPQMDFHFVTKGGKASRDQALNSLDQLVHQGGMDPDEAEGIFQMIEDHYGSQGESSIQPKEAHGAVPRFNAMNTEPFRAPRGADLTDKLPPHANKEQLLQWMKSQYTGGRKRSGQGHFGLN